MAEDDVGGYRVGQRGSIEVLDSSGECFWVEGEIVRLIPVAENTVYALIETRMGRGLYRLR